MCPCGLHYNILSLHKRIATDIDNKTVFDMLVMISMISNWGYSFIVLASTFPIRQILKKRITVKVLT